MSKYLVAALVALCVLVAAGQSYFISSGALNHITIENDDTSYAFQSRLFSQGRAGSELPKEHNLNPTGFAFRSNSTHYFGGHFIGNALSLAPAAYFGVAHLMPPVIAGLATLLLFLIVQNLISTRAGLFAALLFALSPATTGLASTLHSENQNRFFLLLALFSLVKIKDLVVLAGWKRSCLWAIIGGLALGHACNIRPLTSASIAIAFFIWSLGVLWMIPAARRLKACVLGCVFLVGASIGVTPMFLWNNFVTGSYFKPHHIDSGAFGFDDNYTLPTALNRVLQYKIPYLLYHGIGWGEMNASVPLGPLMPFSRSLSSGLIVEAEDDSNNVVLEYRGDWSGAGWLTFWSTPMLNGQGYSSQKGKYNCFLGDCRAQLRLVRAGDRIKSYIRSAEGQEWELLGDAQLSLQGPLRVGAKYTTFSPTESFTATFRNLVIREPKTGKVLRSAFSEPSSLEQQVDHIEGQWKATLTKLEEGGGLSISTLGHLTNGDRSEIRKYLFDVEERDFDISVDLELNWFDPHAPTHRMRWENNKKHALLTLVALIPLALLLAHLGIRRNFWARALFFFALMAPIAAHLPYPLTAFWGNEIPHRVRFYAAGIAIGLIPLVAIALSSISDVLFFNRESKLARIFGGLTLGAIVLSICYAGCMRQSKLFEEYWRYYVSSNKPFGVRDYLPTEVAKLPDEKLVVFALRSSVLPLGDYPFESLDDARVVYYRYVEDQPIREIYQRLFQGRKAYLYDEEGLHVLEAPDFQKSKTIFKPRKISPK